MAGKLPTRTSNDAAAAFELVSENVQETGVMPGENVEPDPGVQDAVTHLPDNILWETDFPHPTCQHPGLEGGATQRPADYADQAFAGIPDDVAEKVLHSTAGGAGGA